MSCESIFRDVSNIHSRLFNHRAALQGLASNFVKEFEEKRGDKELNSLSKNLDLVIECRDHALPYILENIGDCLKELEEETTKTTNECNKALKDSEAKKEWLESQRERRKEEWNAFMNAQVSRSARVDNDYENHVEALEKHYSELEEKVKTSGKAVL